VVFLASLPPRPALMRASVRHYSGRAWRQRDFTLGACSMMQRGRQTVRVSAQAVCRSVLRTALRGML